jgi:hypothetical protein
MAGRGGPVFKSLIKGSFYAYIGFLCVQRNSSGEVRVQLLTSRRFIDIVDER